MKFIIVFVILTLFVGCETQFIKYREGRNIYIIKNPPSDIYNLSAVAYNYIAKTEFFDLIRQMMKKKPGGRVGGAQFYRESYEDLPENPAPLDFFGYNYEDNLILDITWIYNVSDELYIRFDIMKNRDWKKISIYIKDGKLPESFSATEIKNSEHQDN